MNKILSHLKLKEKPGQAHFVRHHMIDVGFDNRAFETEELKEEYINYRWELTKNIWVSWPRLLFIFAFFIVAISFAGLLLLVKIDPNLAQSLIDFCSANGPRF